MNLPAGFEHRLRAVLPSVFALWVLLVLGAAVAMTPVAKSLPFSWDDQVFEPGGMMLIESLRLHRSSFLQGLRQSLILLVAAQLLLLLARARVTAAVVDVAQGRSPRSELFSQAPAYLAVTLVKLIVLAICGGALFLTLKELPPFEGSMPPRLVGLYLFVSALGLSAFGFLLVFADLYRLALFHTLSARERLRAAWFTAKHHAVPLLALRTLWVATGLGTGALTAWIAARPMADASTGAVLTFVISQILVLLNLGVEVWWLSQAERKLALFCDNVS